MKAVSEPMRTRLYRYGLTALFLAFFTACASYRHIAVLHPFQAMDEYQRVLDAASKLLPLLDIHYQDSYRFVIFDDEELNAFAFTHRLIGVNRGLLAAFDNEELTCVLAHEIAHVSYGHSDNASAVQNSPTRVYDELRRVSPNPGILSLLFKDVAVSEYSREQEMDADVEAVRTVERLEIKRSVYLTVLKKLDEYAAAHGTGRGGGILDDHPSLEARIKRINEMESSTQ